MDREDAFTRCLAYLNRQLQPGNRPVQVSSHQRAAVAISRQTGTGAVIIAEKLAAYLQAEGSADDQPWTVFDKNLIAKVLEDHHLPARLAKFLPEDKINAINDMVDELLELHPPSWLIVHQSTETILRLAELGNVILVGRGAPVITRHMLSVLRVRLVGSLERRLTRVQQTEHLGREEALAFIRRTDRGRARYVKKYLRQDVADLLLYDLTINTDRLSDDKAARLIGDAVLGWTDTARGELKRAA